MKRKTKLMIAALIAFVLIVIFAFLFIQNENFTKVCFKNKCIYAEIADSYEEREKGLMFRDNLDEDKGMLFKFEEEGVYSFWMKNTTIPLDMIWINRNFEVVYMEKAMPCYNNECKIYNPGKNALFVLETNQGFVEENNVKLGDSFKIYL